MEQYPSPFSNTDVLRVTDHLHSKAQFELVWKAKQGVAQTLLPKGIHLSDYYPKAKYTSHQETKAGLFGKAYQLAQGYMLQHKFRKLKPYLSPNSRVLDYGCGIGDFANYLKKKGIAVQAVEPNAAARAVANKRGVPTFETLDTITEHPFSVISLWHVLEHLHDPTAALNQFHGLLKEKGQLVLALPNLRSADAQHYGAFWAAYDVPRHLWHFSQSGVHQLASATGFRVHSVFPMPLDALYISLLSEQYKGSFLSPLQGLFRGLWSNSKALSTGEFSSLIYFLEKN